MLSTFILYAPNVHTGGGFVLLQSLLDSWPATQRLQAVLDRRAMGKLSLPVNCEVSWVKPSISSRLHAEYQLWRNTRNENVVLCFHGLPPLFKIRGKVMLFHQNRILLDLMRIRDFPWKTALRISAERVISRLFRSHVDEYIVQTPTMARALSEWHGAEPEIKLLPFLQPISVKRSPKSNTDFVYVSDGLPHKNHLKLFTAWEILASEHIYPRLILTLGPRDQKLVNIAADLSKRMGLVIENVGHLEYCDVLSLYGRAQALIFPSVGESFGLPLIEASQLGLPILAPELDYVRDVCVPTETFDPHSATSIARAVRRFLRQNEMPSIPLVPAAFWSSLGIAGDANNSEGTVS